MLKIIFMGTDDYGIATLNALIKDYKLSAIVTEPDKPQGRGLKLVSPIPKQIADQNNILCFQPERLSSIYDQLTALAPDLIVVAAYGRILPDKVLDLPKYGCLNVHPSLLPKYRGPSPIQTTLLNGDKETGVTIIKLNAKMDSGDIVNQEKLAVVESDDYLAMEKRLSELGAELLIKSIPNFADGKLKLKVQNESKATYCFKIKKEDGRLDWNKSAEQLSNQIKALAKWPTCYTSFAGKKLEVIKAKWEGWEKGEKVGRVIKKPNGFFVQCGEGLLQLEIVKLEGKKEMPIKDFVNGHRNFIDAVLD